MKKRIYGWVPDLPDHRDKVYKIEAPVSLPSKVDLREFMPKVYDQGSLGSCTANAIGAAFQYARIKQKAVDFIPSRLFIYYNERAMEGNIKSDSGAAIRDGIKSVNKQGVCPETQWPYKINKFAVKPPDKCYSEALHDQVVLYQSIPQTLKDIKTSLAKGFPVVFGFSVYESFEDETVSDTGIMTMPTKNEKNMGGHAVLCVGYDDSRSWVIVRNSWGENWGESGYFYMPYDYIINPNLADDFWNITLVEN